MTTHGAAASFRTKPCLSCGKSTTLFLAPEKLRRWEKGELIQHVWPEMPAPEREMLLTGTHPECFAAMFPEEE
jgi:hypothetical protein